MKKFNHLIVCLITVMLPFATQAQKITYTVTGKVGLSSAPQKAYLLSNQPGGFTGDSTTLVNGKFNFTDKVSSPHMAFLFIGTDMNDKNLKQASIYLEEGSISVFSPNTLDNAVITGGPMNTDNNELRKALKPVVQKSNILNQEFLTASEEKRKSKTFMADFNKKHGILEAESTQIDADFIRKHPNSGVSLQTLRQIGSGVPDVAIVGPLFDSLSETLRNSDSGKQYGEMLKKMRTTMIGVIAPDFTQSDTSGKAIALHDFKGKYVLVDFWASWCAPCREENPNVVSAYNNYKNRGLEIIGVSLDQQDAKEKWIKAIQDDHVTWTQLSDLKGWQNQVARLYAVYTIPQNFLIDPDGIIIGKNLRGEDLNSALEKIFVKK